MSPVIRPMRPEDVPVAERLSAEGFYELDIRMRAGCAGARAGPPRTRGVDPRTRHFLRHRPGRLLGRRGRHRDARFRHVVQPRALWCLATYAVRPGLQGQGIGRPLLEAALHHGRGCLRGMLSASSDPKAMRRYRAAGFELHPQMFLPGPSTGPRCRWWRRCARARPGTSS